MVVVKSNAISMNSSATANLDHFKQYVVTLTQWFRALMIRIQFELVKTKESIFSVYFRL